MNAYYEKSRKNLDIIRCRDNFFIPIESKFETWYFEELGVEPDTIRLKLPRIGKQYHVKKCQMQRMPHRLSDEIDSSTLEVTII